MNLRNPFIIGCGNFFFKFRSVLFPVIYLLLLVFFKPRVYAPYPLYQLTLAVGFILVVVGQLIRVLTIGLDYIERGGKDGKPWASRLVRGGLYNHVRNPMYLGNLTMALGIGLYSGAPLVLAIALPFFFFAYISMIAAEENFLRGKFGEEFEQFSRDVNRLIPSFKGMKTTFSNVGFNVKRVLAKENGTLFYTSLAIVWIPLWRSALLFGTHSLGGYKFFALGFSVLLTAFYVTTRILKKTGRLTAA